MVVALPRWMVRLLVVGATTMIVLGVYGYRILGLKSDWIAYYTAGMLFTQGKSDLLYDPITIHAWEASYIGDNIVRFLYPPAYSLIFSTLAILDAKLARPLWLMVGLAASLAAAWLSKPWTQLSREMRFIGLLAFPPLAYSLAVGQTTPITLLIFSTIAFLEWKGENGYLPGLLAGLVLFKPQLLVPLVLYWLCQKRWKSLVGFSLSLVTMVLVSIAISWPATVDYIRLTLEFLTLAQVSTKSGANAALFAINPWLGIGIAAIVLLVLGLSSFKESKGYSQALLWLAPVLVTPYIVIYDLLLLILPISFLVPRMANDRPLRIMVSILWISSFLVVIVMNTRPVTLAALGLFAFCVWRIFILPVSVNSSSQTTPPQSASPE